MSESKITIGTGATVFAGRDAVELYRVKALHTALRLNAATGLIPTRGMTRRRMLNMAGQITGRRFKNSAQGVDDALAALAEFASLLASSLPIDSASV